MTIIIGTTAQLLRDIENKRIKLIVYGTGVLARELASNPAIMNAISVFTDSDKTKHGKAFVCEKNRWHITAPPEISDYVESNSALIIASSHYKEIIFYLEEFTSLSNIPCYVYPLMRINYSADEYAFYEARFIREAQNEYNAVFEDKDVIKSKIDDMQKKDVDGNYPLIIPRIMIMPSTRCNMRCAGCSSLFPLFKKPENIPLAQLKNDVEIFFSTIDECARLTIGGEPFLYPDIKSLIEFLLQIPNLHGILMFTNSTIIPKDDILPLLKNKKIMINISDYGHIDTMSRLVSLFEKEQIQFDVLSEQTWTDMGGIEFRGKERETLRYEYLNCEQSRIIKALYKGKLYICARSARMHALKIYNSEHDNVTLDKSLSKNELRNKIRALFFSEYADACNYCDLGKFPTTMIPAGVQINSAFKKSKSTKSNWTLVRRDEYNKLKAMEKITNV